MKQKLDLNNVAIFCESEQEKALAIDIFLKFNSNLKNNAIPNNWKSCPYIYIKKHDNYIHGSQDSYLSKYHQKVKYKDLNKKGFKFPKLKISKWKVAWKQN